MARKDRSVNLVNYKWFSSWCLDSDWSLNEPIRSLIENQPDSSDGKHMLKTENSDKKRGSVAFLPPPALPMAAT